MLRTAARLNRLGLRRRSDAISARYLSASADFFTSYEAHVDERAAMGISPLPINASQTSTVTGLLDAGGERQAELLGLLEHRVPPGVDESAYVKATYLSAISTGGRDGNEMIDKMKAVEMLGTMQGGYNVGVLVSLLEKDDDLAYKAADQLKKTLLMFDAFHDVEETMKKGSKSAKAVMESWAAGEWFTNRGVPENMLSVTVFKVTGETNTDDLSPAPDAWSRPDIPLHSLAMLKTARDGIIPDLDGEIGPIGQMQDLKDANGLPLAYVGDVVGTGSSRKSATNSVLWHMGTEIPFVPNICGGGLCIGGKIAPIFFNTMEDSGALPLEMDVNNLEMGDAIDVYIREGVVKRHGTDSILSEGWGLKTDVILDEVQAGGRIPLIIGRGLTARARSSLGMDQSTLFRLPVVPESKKTGFTLAQKMVGRACGLPEGEGILPGTYCEPSMTTVGSQDTTGPMTRDELRSLACLGFSADLTMQSFCHTAAYPKPVDVITHATLPDFVRDRGGVSLRPGDGIIHSWLNRMLLPDTVGTGGDSHTRFPIGVSFPAGSGLVAFAAATGIMPLDMPESVLVRFHGELQKGITLRDLVQSIPYQAVKMGLLTVEKKGKINAFSGRILEIEGLPDLKCEQAFELSDASAERSAAGCTIQLNSEPIIEYLNSNIVMLKWMIAEGYGDPRTIERRIARMEEWLENPTLLKADPDAEYAEIIEIDLNELKEPVLACPNDPDDSALLSELVGTHIDEVFIGSCMTNIGHFRAAGKLLRDTEKSIPTRLWVAPPTKMDAAQLTTEGYYSIFGAVGARTEMPGCSLCMGNQARVGDAATVVSTSTRNFPNRLGKGANVYLSSAELAAVAAIEGELPSVETYLKYMEGQNTTPEEREDTYRYLNFNELPEFVDIAAKVEISDAMKEAAKKMRAA